ncbi:MAG: ABC transporter permease [Qingshengfaniella sp.]
MKQLLFGRVESGVVIGAVLIIAFFALSTGGMWFSSVPSVLRVTAAVGIIAIGQAILMTAGEVDLSVGSVFAFVGVIFISVMDSFPIGVVPSMLIALVAACAIGALNGVITTLFRVPSMIVTLGGLFVYRGITYLATQGFSLSIPRVYRRDDVVLFLKSRIGDINVTVIILAMLMVLFVFILAKTRFGSHVLAVGGNADAALANGISPVGIKIKAFVLCSGLAGLAGILVVCQEGSVYSTSGVKMELETIAAAVIGGCTLRGGVGSVWGPVLGVFVLSSLKGGLMLMGAPTSWYIALVGAILIAFLLFSRLLSTRMGGVA